MTRVFACVLAVVVPMGVGSLVTLQTAPKSPAAAILGSLAGGIMLAFAVTAVLLPIAEREDRIASGPHVLRSDDDVDFSLEPVYAELLAAMPAREARR